MTREFCVYTIFNKISGKVYVGKTVDYARRMVRHLNAANNKGGEKPRLIHRALHKYGSNNFNFSILQTFTNNEDCLLAEKYWIKYFRSNEREFGYNLTEGGESGIVGYVHSDKARRIISEKATGRKHSPETIEKLKQRKQSLPGVIPANLAQLKIMNVGRKHTKQAKENMSNARIGMVFSEEHRANMAAARIGLFDSEKNPFYGKTHTEEVKISCRGENNKHSKLKARQVLEIREKYDSGNYTKYKLAEEYNISRAQIRRVVNRIDWKHI